MDTSKSSANEVIVVSALHVRANLGRLLRRVEDESRSLVIEKRGTPRAVLLSIRDYVRLAAPEPAVLEMLGREANHKGRHSLKPSEIDRVIKTTRPQNTHRW